MRDVRACFLGDSFVAGVGDPQYLGWVGRLAARTRSAGTPLTAYTLGVRRDTSSDVLARWRAECGARLPNGCDARLVVAFGYNDTTIEHGRPRTALSRSRRNLRELLTGAADRGWPALVVGPPPSSCPQRTTRLHELDEAFAAECLAIGTPYVSVLAPLRDSPWLEEVERGDGAHPSAGGYDCLARTLWPAWTRWLSAVPADS